MPSSSIGRLRFFLYSVAISIAELIASLDAVDAAAVRRFGTRIMEAGIPAVAAVGPVSQLESYDAFARRFGTGRSLKAAE